MAYTCAKHISLNLVVFMYLSVLVNCHEPEILLVPLRSLVAGRDLG